MKPTQERRIQEIYTKLLFHWSLTVQLYLKIPIKLPSYWNQYILFSVCLFKLIWIADRSWPGCLHSCTFHSFLPVLSLACQCSWQISHWIPPLFTHFRYSLRKLVTIGSAWAYGPAKPFNLPPPLYCARWVMSISCRWPSVHLDRKRPSQSLWKPHT